MKIFRLLATSLLVAVCTGFSSCSKETANDEIEWQSSMILNISQAGTLNSLIPNEKRNLIKELTLIGNINSNDFQTLRELGINKNLTSLDLSKVHIDELSIPDAAFRDCSKIEKISLPTNITNIGDWAFGGCCSLSSIDLPSNLSSIGNAAFCGCKGLRSITIPEKIEAINTSTFSECENLISINITPNIQQIKYQAFYGCKKLTSINIPKNVVIIEKEAFERYSSYIDCDKMMELELITFASTQISTYICITKRRIYENSQLHRFKSQSKRLY